VKRPSVHCTTKRSQTFPMCSDDTVSRED
jgi:hypothetical protein